MPRFRLQPSPAQEAVLREHCRHARFVWNLAVEQQSWWRPGRGGAPRYLEQCRQLTAARADHDWLRAGSQMVQQQALRDFDQAMRNFYAGSHRRPSWRKKNTHEGFRPAPGTGAIVGIDRGIVASAALSTGELLTAPRLSPRRQQRLRLLQRKLARAKRGSSRRAKVRLAAARLTAHQSDARNDWCEKLSTDLACRYDLIRVEDLHIQAMTRSARGSTVAPGRGVAAKAGLNRQILVSGWGQLVRRLDDKAPGRVERIKPAFTSRRCSACGHIAAESRKSQALFACVACNFTLNADLNAARNIAAGHAVTARGGDRAAGPVNREPQPLLLTA